MDSPNPDALDERALAETPEDVAVLYSWANLQGAKYRDFSASRREYRAQMRHRAAEQQREEEMRAKAEAEAAAAEAERAAREAEEAARFHETAAKKASEHRQRQEMELEEAAQARAMQHAAELNRKAASERVEAARRAEAVAAAEAAARREAREMAEAQASAARQAARYAESEYMRRSLAGPQPSAIVPGQITDPYTNEEPAILPGRLFHQPQVQEDDMQPTRLPRSREARLLIPQPDPRDKNHPIEHKEYWVTGSVEDEARIAAGGTAAIEEAAHKPKGQVSYYYEPDSVEKQAAVEHYAQAAPYAAPEPVKHRYEETETTPGLRGSIYNLGSAAPPQRGAVYESRPAEEMRVTPAPRRSSSRQEQKPVREVQVGPSYDPVPARGPSKDSGYEAAKAAASAAEARANKPRRSRGYQPDEASGIHQSFSGGSPFAKGAPEPEGALPEWIESSQIDVPRGREEQRSAAQPRKLGVTPAAGTAVTETLQHSRERVAARWYALKGIFDHTLQEAPMEPPPVRQKETRAAMLAVFSLAGGVGKTSLVATMGRALSSTGEKVLLTDMTAHGLMPYYFGASELRPGSVRTFSPPSGSSDAPISLVSFAVAQGGGDAAAQEMLAEELTRASRGVQRVIVDMSAGSAWVMRRLVRMGSMVLVPLAPDMNSVISLGPVEKFFAGMIDGEGKPVQPYYLLNQFDASLPLHLDVREVMRQQLGERLLPFTIRRSPVVSEALAEGMTVMDYAPDAPVATDYMNLASWLRAQSAPAVTGYKNARWSER